jgi:MFS family permease
LGQPAGRSALRHANFRYFLTARFLITLSSEMQSVAVAWQIYAMTSRPLDLGLVGLAQFLPGILLFLVAGHAADKFERRHILQVCYGAFSLCSALLLWLALHHVASPWPIYAVLLLNGAIRAFNGPANQSIVPALVPVEDFPNAIAWGSSVFQTAAVLGPAAGGLIYGFASSPVPVFCCAGAAYVAAFALLAAVRVNARDRTRPAASIGMVLEGVRYIFRNKLILGSISLDLFAVLLGGAVALLPVYAREILHAGAYGLGVLRSAPAVGAVVMGLVVAHWPLKRRAGVAMLASVFAFGIFTVLFGLSRNIVLSVAALILAGASDTVSVIVRHTLLQLATPDHMRGRVSAVNMIFIGASNEVGQFESGLAAHWFGTVPAVVLGGLGTMAIVIIWALNFPVLRQIDQLVPDAISPEGRASKPPSAIV